MIGTEIQERWDGVEEHRKWLERSSALHGTVWMRNDVIHFTPLRKALAECQVALLSSGGVHRRDQVPFDAENEQGDPSYRVIPDDTPTERLMVSHTHYNHADADRDINCVFPLDRLHELAEEGVIGRAAPRHFGFMGYNPDPRQLAQQTAGEIAEHLRRDGTDLVVITPG